MIIYYISETNSLNRPVDIQQSGIHLLKDGDVCIRTHGTNISVILLSDIHKCWSDNRIIASYSNKLLVDPGNVILYSYDGFSRRFGNIDILSELFEIFKDNIIIAEFLRNAINILKYNSDSFNYDILSKLFKGEDNRTPGSNTILISEKDASSPLSPLSPFLPSTISDMLTEYLESGLTTYECYCKIRQLFPQDFIKACKEYSKTYPGRGIY